MVKWLEVTATVSAVASAVSSGLAYRAARSSASQAEAGRREALDSRFVPYAIRVRSEPGMRITLQVVNLGFAPLSICPSGLASSVVAEPLFIPPAQPADLEIDPENDRVARRGISASVGIRCTAGEKRSCSFEVTPLAAGVSDLVAFDAVVSADGSDITVGSLKLVVGRYRVLPEVLIQRVYVE